MPDTTPLLALPYLLAAQAQKHVTHNAALQALDALVQLSVLDRSRTAPPGAPQDGDRHLVAAGATGLWAGWDGDIAYRIDGAWLRLIPHPGWLLWVADETLMLLRDATGWVALADVLGVTGATGATGLDGASAYQIWLDAGNIGTEAQFLASLVGATGQDGAIGPEGPQGPVGPAGADGANGADGASVSIVGALGSTAELPASGATVGDGYVIAGTLHVWDGTSWIEVGPIQGPQGEPGPAGVDGVDGMNGADGADGASAYAIWLAAGNTGTEAEFLAALVGPQGNTGPEGPEGPQGLPGTDGVNGIDGTNGINGVNGSDGLDGAPGADGVGFLWRGPWASGSAYAAQDVVSQDGASWLCVSAHVADATTEPGVGASAATVWDLAAAKGAAGDITAQGMIGTGPVVLARRPITTQATSYLLALGDEGASVQMVNAAAATVFVPAEASVGFVLGTEIEIVALGAGAVTIAADAGVILNGVAEGSADIAGAFQGAVLRKYAADTWLVMGAIGAVA